MNNLELEAQRKALGLSVAELAELAGVSKRSVQYWQQGKRPVPGVVFYILIGAGMYYLTALDMTKRNIDRAAPPTTLPYYQQQEDFIAATGCHKTHYWRIYQMVVGQLSVQGRTKLDDKAEIPANFWLWKWLKGEFEHGY